MDLIVDTSVLIAVATNEPEKTALVEHTVGSTLLAPASVHWEIGNAFSAMLKRRRITLEKARTALAAVETVPIGWLDVPLAQALELAARLEIYAYDAYVIAAALNQSCALLTLDRGMVRSAKTAGVNVLEVNR
jgi:predicted nucleic acid-binding protein